ncbi:MAG: hypothetical protein IIW48_09950 [Clostridia bacterium]|nr:hypothetical protein [Clostridia bacterium]
MKIKRIIALMLAAVILFALTACKGKDAAGPEPGKLYAGLNLIYEDYNSKDFYLRNQDLFIKAAQTEFGLSESDAQDFLKGGDNWVIYSLHIEVSNNTDKSYTFVSFNGSELPDGMWLSTCPMNGELSVPPAQTDILHPATLLVDSDKVDANDMYTAVAGMDIDIICYETPADDNEEVPESKREKLKVAIHITAPEDDNVKAEDQISAKRTTVEDGSDFLEAFRSNSVAFYNEAKLYGMTQEIAEQVIAAGSGWECYVLNIEIANKTEDDLTVYTLKSEDNGKTGAWICSVSQYGEFGMSANDTQVLPVSVLVNTAELGGKTAQDVISGMKISLEYIAGEVVDEYGNENVLPTKTVEVK